MWSFKFWSSYEINILLIISLPWNEFDETTYQNMRIPIFCHYDLLLFLKRASLFQPYPITDNKKTTGPLIFFLSVHSEIKITYHTWYRYLQKHSTHEFCIEVYYIQSKQIYSESEQAFISVLHLHFGLCICLV